MRISTEGKGVAAIAGLWFLTLVAGLALNLGIIYLVLLMVKHVFFNS